MDYEKAYKNLVAKVKNAHLYAQTDSTKNVLEDILPQLRESEDEKIRKEIVSALKFANDGGVYDKHIAYLEKQKEWKHYWKPTETDVALFSKAITTNKALTPTERAQLDIIRSKFGCCRATNCSGIVQKEQKPAEWSEDDEEMLNSCISSIEESKENRYAYKETDGDTSYDREVDWLKSLRPSWKPSEEQIDALKELIDDANRAGWVTPGATELYEQLKKL